MRGRANRQPNLFVSINLEALVPTDHPLRAVKRMADEALAAMGRTFTAAYAAADKGGRPSIPPERLVKALLLMSLYTVRSERALCERITFDMLFRWFLDMTPDERCFDHSTFTVNRERLDRLEITRKFSDRIVMAAIEAGLISEDHFSIDGSLLQSHASLKSLRRIEQIRAAAQGREKGDGPGTPGPGASSSRPDSNPWVDFKGQKRSNKTHRSTTDPEARLYRKGDGQPALLSHSMHVLMENRHGLGVAIRIDKADGRAEHRSALKLIDAVKRRLGLEPATLGMDKNYDAGPFLAELDRRGVEAHAACKSEKQLAIPDEGDDAAWARWFNQQGREDAGFAVSRRKRKLDEEVFGWLKQFGGLRRVRVVGRWKIQQLADIALSALNLTRMSRLLAG